MPAEDTSHGPLSNECRKELIDYYKWIVSLAIFVLTISLTLSGLFPRGLNHSWILVVGWAFLAACVFLNWLIIKRLVTIPIVLSTPEHDRGLLHEVFIASMRNLKRYGLLQNWCFLLGTCAIGVGYALNVFQW